MLKEFIEKISSLLPETTVSLNVPLKPLTTMKVGGDAACLVEARNEDDIRMTVAAAKKFSVPLLIIGNGSNMIISDRGFPGAVLHLSKQMSFIRNEGNLIFAQAGALLPAVSRYAAENNLTGLEFASGIPGSVGGAVVMNAGAYGSEMKHVLKSVTVLAGGEIRSLDAKALELSYRHSRLMDHPDWIVLSAVFELQNGDHDLIFAQMNDLNARRREKQPLQYPNSGSFFKRPEGHFAGALIENANLKGYSVGGAQVSQLHAGFFINTGNATADDVYNLMKHVQKKVYDTFSVSLEPEVRLIGEFEE